jgi:hypothetical protein
VPVAKREHGRLDEIERDLLDESTSLATALRKAVALGGELRSAPLREWAGRELRGYEDGPDLPEYRKVQAPLLIDGATFRSIVKRQRISPSALPDAVQEHVSETVELRGGVGVLEDLAQKAEASGEGAIKISPAMSADIVRLMNYEAGPGGDQIMDLYWAVSTSAVRGVLDRIRTAAVEIMSELRAATPADDSAPSPEAADQAVNVVLHGGKRNRVTVTTAQADHGATATAPAERSESGWTKTQTIWTVIGVVIAIIALYVAYRQWRG